jgi:hypothetical protein
MLGHQPFDRRQPLARLQLPGADLARVVVRDL